MNMFEIVKAIRQDDRLIRFDGASVLVATDCLYPSFSSVTVAVEGGKDHFMVHDGKGAVIEAAAAAVHVADPVKILRPIASSYGLSVTRSGGITSALLPASEVQSLILMVSNASRDAAHALLAKFRPNTSRDAREVVREILEKRFAEPRIHANVTFEGVNKKHNFDYAVDFENGKRLLLDIVTPDASSVNSAVVAGFDIANKIHDGRIVSRMVYDEQKNWNPQDLALLSAIGRPIQLSRLSTAIEKLAA